MFTLAQVSRLVVLLTFSGGFLLIMTMDFSFSARFISTKLPEPLFFALGLVVPMIVLACSLACDIGFVALTRLTLKWCSTEEGAFKIFGAVFLNSFLGVILGIGPFLLSYKDWRVLWETKGLVRVNWLQGLKILGMALSATNTVDILAAGTFTLLAILLLAHRLFWPILMRPTYVLADLGIIGRRKLFGIVGVALLGYAAGLDIHGWFKEIIGVVTK